MKVAVILFFGFIVIAVIGIYYFTKSDYITLGNSLAGFQNPADSKMSTVQAVNLAQPFLEESYRIRRLKLRRNQNPSQLGKALVWASYRGHWFYITQDDYPSYSPGYYVHYSVRVNALTQQVIPTSQ